MRMKTYILLDRSGSMMTGWNETVGALGAFIDGMKTHKKKAKIHLAAFDGVLEGVEYAKVFDGKRKDYRPKVLEAYPPRGNTPLYDAVAALGKVIAADQPEKAQIVIITDGFENASKECNLDAAKAFIKAWEAKDFDVIYMGASFEGATQQAAAMGIAAGQTVNMTDKSAYAGTMSAMSTRNTSYAKGLVSNDDDLGDDIRDAADKT